MTRPLRAIADLVAAKSVSRDIVEQALTEGRQRGLLPVREVAELHRQGAFRVALEDPLKKLAQDDGLDRQRLRRHAAFDRLLCRLFAEPDAPWLLKGGYAMELRLKTARTTRDIDLVLNQTWRDTSVWLIGARIPRRSSCHRGPACASCIGSRNRTPFRFG